MTDSLKRNYIRRKKYFNESFEQIKNTLDRIASSLSQEPKEDHNRKLAQEYAQSVEAACWSPHSQLSSEEYRLLMNSKTQELCRVLMSQNLPNFDLKEMQRPPPNPIPIISNKTRNISSKSITQTIPLNVPSTVNQPLPTPQFSMFENQDSSSFTTSQNLYDDIFNPESNSLFSIKQDQFAFDSFLDNSLFRIDNLSYP